MFPNAWLIIKHMNPCNCPMFSICKQCNFFINLFPSYVFQSANNANKWDPCSNNTAREQLFSDPTF